MTIKISDKQLIQLMGLLFFGFLLWLSWNYFNERMISYDSANYSLNIIQNKTFCLPHGRWGSICSQIFPLIALKPHCSLKTFLIIYSTSFIAIYYLIFLICTLVLK